ncbi:unnamed protein product [Rhodiola kirilowii]
MSCCRRELSLKMMKYGVDRLSDLPEGLKGTILECLPIKDAVRTSILSSEWRYIWTFMKRLDFGKAFVRVIRKYTRENYTTIIDRILLMHHGPIQYVSLFIPWDDMIGFDAWLLNWSRKGIQELEINAFRDQVLISHLPSSLFRFQSLTSVKLTSCELKPPPEFSGFCNLVTLHLRNVMVSSDSLGTFISRCRQLENLSIKYSFFCCLADPLIINAPNLRTMEFWGCTSGAIVFENVPRLSEVSLRHSLIMQLHMPEHHSKMCNPFNLLSSLHKIQKLDSDLCLLEHFNGDSPDNLPMLLINLKTLRLNFLRICNRKDIAFIFCLLRSAPSLQTLHIEVFQDLLYSPKAVADCLEVLEVEGKKAIKFNELVTLNIGLINNLWAGVYEPTMFKLIEILLSSCPLLKTLYVAPNLQKYRDAVKLARVTKLLQFHRFSSNAKIIVGSCVQ